MKDEGCGCFLIIIVFVVLFFTNPEKRDHREEVGSVLQEALSEDIDKLLDKYCAENPSEFCSSREDNSLINEFIGGMSRSMLKEQVETFVNEEVNRKNYFIFSLTTVNGDIVGLGILNMVFVTSDKIEEDFLENLLF
jgi:hypothetical protein